MITLNMVLLSAHVPLMVPFNAHYYTKYGAAGWSPRAHLHVVGMIRFVSDINQPSLPTPFYSVLMSISVFTAHSTVFHSITSPDNSPFSDSVLPVLSLPYLVLSTLYLFYESLLQP